MFQHEQAPREKMTPKQTKTDFKQMQTAELVKVNKEQRRQATLACLIWRMKVDHAASIWQSDVALHVIGSSREIVKKLIALCVLIVVN
ncbi:hypothetical protein CEXT_471881 [Caerostris extrusa]|uniref:Uncharacterized protein n=1 Tax=Caerostris extrusa TaxID=172846 RepID=A0AAV4MGQ9_CAEEX|nr:hypothetical protein CEXT_471881 [Caerostris extrusa]